ncbi:hypothetical protein QVD17_28552 [Tagetes erecta]|uniref:Uncharacterized protein n=1 Tax=Tagetes erecta TaxID=13708 RepID=A0AAD8NKK2_TARER|nr:hypothetical protein QVD17_28552 [Tagetes erecta]
MSLPLRLNHRRRRCRCHFCSKIMVVVVVVQIWDPVSPPNETINNHKIVRLISGIGVAVISVISVAAATSSV